MTDTAQVLLVTTFGIATGFYIGYDYHKRIQWPKRLDEIANRIVARCKESGIKIVDDKEFTALVNKHHGGYQ